MAAYRVTAHGPGALLSCCVQYERFVYPPHDAPLIEAYGGRFESLYVILHPFIRVPEELAWKTARQYPSDEQILTRGTKCPWARVAAQTGLRGCARLNQALLTSILAINEELCDFEARGALQGFLESGSVWMPSEGRFEPLLQADILNAFEAARKSELVSVPEFPEADPVRRLDVVQLRSRKQAFPARGSLMPADGSFLFTVDWDSFFTLLYGPRALIAAFAARRQVEGFWAGPTTEHFWFNYAMGCATVTVSPEDWHAAG